MKKMIVFVILSLLLFGCRSGSSDEDLTDLQYKEYKNYIQLLEKRTDFKDFDENFSIRVITNKTNKQNYRYDIIIDNPTSAMYGIKAIALVPNDGDISYPSIGILENETFSLIPGVVDKKNNIFKGINLSAISNKKNIEILIYITYYNTKAMDTKMEERFLKVLANATG